MLTTEPTTTATITGESVPVVTLSDGTATTTATGTVTGTELAVTLQAALPVDSSAVTAVACIWRGPVLCDQHVLSHDAASHVAAKHVLKELGGTLARTIELEGTVQTVDGSDALQALTLAAIDAIARGATSAESDRPITELHEKLMQD